MMRRARRPGVPGIILYHHAPVIFCGAPGRRALQTQRNFALQPAQIFSACIAFFPNVIIDLKSGGSGTPQNLHKNHNNIRRNKIMFDIRKFGAYISKLRKDADMTQSMLADKLNLTRQTVSSYETGESFPDISILVLISKEFGVTIDDLIKSGEPTSAEEFLLKADAKKSDIPPEIFQNPNISREILNIAPLLKPSILEKVAKGFKKHDLDISSLVTLAEYLKDETFLELLEKADFETLDKDILEKFMPFLDDASRYNLFAKIVEGEIDYHFLEIYLPYVDPYYVHAQVEAAVVAGTIPWDALDVMREAFRPIYEKQEKERIAAGWVKPKYFTEKP